MYLKARWSWLILFAAREAEPIALLPFLCTTHFTCFPDNMQNLSRRTRTEGVRLRQGPGGGGTLPPISRRNVEYEFSRRYKRWYTFVPPPVPTLDVATVAGRMRSMIAAGCLRMIQVVIVLYDRNTYDTRRISHFAADTK